MANDACMIVDDLQLSLRHIGVGVPDVELIGDYLYGDSEQFPHTLLKRADVRTKIQQFARDHPDIEAGQRAAWLFHS